MELDNLKAIWKAQDTVPEIQPDMQQLLQKKSGGHIARMRRNVRIEALAMLVSYIPCIILYLAWFDGRLWFISLMMSVILVCYFVYFLRKDRLLRKMQCVTCEVRSNLARQVKILEKYLRFYLWTTTLVIIISWAIAYIAIRYALQFRGLVVPKWLGPVLLILLIPCSIGIHYLNKRYFNKLYGRDTQKLKDLLREMDEV
jgi:hypothetical protein